MTQRDTLSRRGSLPGLLPRQREVLQLADRPGLLQHHIHLPLGQLPALVLLDVFDDPPLFERARSGTVGS